MRTNRADASDPGPLRVFNPWDVFVLWAASMYSPLSVWSVNSEGPSLTVALVVAAALFTVALALRLILMAMGADRAGSTYVAAFAVLFFSVGGSLIDRAPLGRIGLVALGIAVALIIYRLRDLNAMRWLLAWGSFLLVIGPLTTVAMGWFEEGVDSQVSLELASGSVVAGDDIVVILADAYPSQAVLEEFYDFDNSGFVLALQNRGFVAGDILANYSHTTLSVPSLLQMDYVADDAVLNSADVQALLEVVGGENSFSNILRNSGYSTVYVESGWLGTQCGPSVDVCVNGPWPDETYYDIAYRTLLRDLPGFITGTSFNRGAMNTFDWLDVDLGGYLENDEPEYIYVHMLAPHPPLFLDAGCRSNRVSELGGFSITYPGLDDAENQARRDAYVDQVACVNNVMLDVADQVIEAGATLVFLGDHGPDGQSQLYTNGDAWTESQIAERLSTFVATYTPGCEVVLAASIVDVMPSLLNCLGGPVIDARDPRVFVARRDAEGTHVVETAAPEALVASG